MLIIWMAWPNCRGHFSPYGFRAVSFGGVSKLLSITKMLKFNSATKQFLPITRRAKRTLGIAIKSKQLSTRSYNLLSLSSSMFQMLICNFTTKQVLTVTKRASTYHRSAFPIAIERADITSSILDFQVDEFRFYDTTCFVLSFSLYWLNRCPILESRLCVCRCDKTYSVATKQVATKSLCSMTCLGLDKTLNSKPRLIGGTGRRLVCTQN